ncbi:unnamed protein product [Prorocentrum cordatum]|uniref:Uncharacterized protein n=1 Tax=Prorocentrum cordatum TaxID=2364126 RepID=A0ABN9PGF6_9DINO|nr:unnamed protein product [Polarella glacialis]
MARELGMSRAATPQGRLAALLGLDLRAAEGADAVILRGMRLAAMYRVHCHCRHGQLRRGRAAAEALRQACREVGATGGSRRRRLLLSLLLRLLWRMPAHPRFRGMPVHLRVARLT